MRVRLSRWAEMDLIEITDFIALDNPERASEFEDELLEHARKIAQAPLGYIEPFYGVVDGRTSDRTGTRKTSADRAGSRWNWRAREDSNL